MEKYTIEEMNLINSLNKPINNVDMNLIESIITKMINNHEYDELISFFNNLYDFAELPKSIVDKLIKDNNKECISILLENENILYFLSTEEKNKLKDYINVYEVNVKLNESYDYYYNLLFKHGVRHFKSIKINDNTIEHIFSKNNILIKLKLKEIDGMGLFVSYINYCNYFLSKEEQILKEIDYINEFGFNLDRDINIVL